MVEWGPITPTRDDGLKGVVNVFQPTLKLYNGKVRSNYINKGGG